MKKMMIILGLCFIFNSIFAEQNRSVANTFDLKGMYAQELQGDDNPGDTEKPKSCACFNAGPPAQAFTVSCHDFQSCEYCCAKNTPRDVRTE